MENLKKDLNINQVLHKIEGTIELKELCNFFEKQTGVKIEGNIKKVSLYQYAESKEIELTFTSLKEDRLRELTFNSKKE